MGIGKLFPLVTTESSTRIGFRVCTDYLLLSDWDLLSPLVLVIYRCHCFHAGRDRYVPLRSGISPSEGHVPRL